MVKVGFSWARNRYGVYLVDEGVMKLQWECSSPQAAEAAVEAYNKGEPYCKAMHNIQPGCGKCFKCRSILRC